MKKRTHKRPVRFVMKKQNNPTADNTISMTEIIDRMVWPFDANREGINSRFQLQWMEALHKSIVGNRAII